MPPSIFKGFPLAHKLLDDGIRIEERGLPESCFCDLKGTVDEIIGILFAYLDH